MWLKFKKNKLAFEAPYQDLAPTLLLAEGVELSTPGYFKLCFNTWRPTRGGQVYIA